MRSPTVPLSGCERILIVKPSSLGDVVHTLPAAEAIHRAAPRAKIDWLVNTEWSPLLEGLPFLHRRIPFPRRELRGLKGILRARQWADRELRPGAYDLAIDFQGLLRSAWLARRSGATVLAGFQRSREGASLFYHHRASVPGWDRLHAVDRNLSLATSLGASIADPVFHLPAGTAPAGLLHFPAPPLLLHPFSRGTGKSLSVAETTEICRQLAPWPVVLVGIPEKPLGVAWPDNTTDLLGRTSLAELIHLIRLAGWTVSVDSGPMHLAAALTDRILSIHTWSNPAMVGPRCPGAWIWREGRLVRIRDLDPDAFPERRDLAAAYASRDRLLDPDAIAAISHFLKQQLSSIA